MFKLGLNSTTRQNDEQSRTELGAEFAGVGLEEAEEWAVRDSVVEGGSSG